MLRILLVNPPIYDFSAYDFWLKPYGLLQIGGMAKRCAKVELFDFLDRLHPSVSQARLKSDRWGRGKFYSVEIKKPSPLSFVPRKYKRYGIPRDAFQQFLSSKGHFDYVLVTCTMTYWYLGAKEVICDIRKYSPKSKIILGGNYATICYDHARRLDVDLIVPGKKLQKLWEFVGIKECSQKFPLWDLYPKIESGVLRLTDGCPYKCTYCVIPTVESRFTIRNIESVLKECLYLARLGATNIAFYDDALLINPKKGITPFLKAIQANNVKVNFHTPNAIHIKHLTYSLARLMKEVGFVKLYLGFESSSANWQRQTGGKLGTASIKEASDLLKSAGFDLRDITAYIILGHPLYEIQNIEDAMIEANRAGFRIMLSEFSPIPGTPDGKRARKWVDLDEPLMHNKTAFPIAMLGEDTVNRLKRFCNELNSKLF